MTTEKVYDLEQRTYLFAKNCRQVVSLLSKSVSNIEDSKQLIRSSGSIAANYIEANENLGEKDFKFRLKIARKEAKESTLWLKLLIDMNPNNNQLAELLDESEQLRKILSAIIKKA